MLASIYIFVIASASFDFVFSLLAKRLAGKSVKPQLCQLTSGSLCFWFCLAVTVSDACACQIWLQNRLIHVCLTGAGAVLFSLYIIYDVSMIMKKVSPEEYVLAAATLYLDIINLFIKLLELFGERKQK